MANTATSLGRSTGTQAILLWLNRNDAVDTIKSSPADAWRNFLQRQVGGTDTSGKRDLERIWLSTRIVALGGSGANLSLTELWVTYLNLKGFSGGLDDMFAQWIDHGTV